jgi:hypothetical protein
MIWDASKEGRCYTTKEGSLYVYAFYYYVKQTRVGSPEAATPYCYGHYRVVSGLLRLYCKSKTCVMGMHGASFELDRSGR